MSNDFRVDVKHLNKSKRHQWSFGKKLSSARRSSSCGGNSRKKSCRTSRGSEYFPLMSDDDDEEIVTVHDSSIFRLRQRNSPNKRSPEQQSSEPDDNDQSELATKAGVNGFKNDTNSKADPFLNREMITVKMKDGDTLQSISLKYRCSISDIKRANNLISDQDFYALPHLKIPVRKHSVLLQPVPTDEPCNHREEGNNKNSVRAINLGLMLPNNSPQDAAEFLKRMDEDLVKIVLNTKSRNDTLDGASSSAAAAASSSFSLGSSSIQPELVKDLNANPYVMCNIHWSYVLFFMVIISIVSVAVIFYINYVRTSHNSTQQNQAFPGGDHFSSSQRRPPAS